MPNFQFLLEFGNAVIGVYANNKIIIPQLSYCKDKENYFLITEDYEKYKKNKGSE